MRTGTARTEIRRNQPKHLAIKHGSNNIVSINMDIIKAEQKLTAWALRKTATKSCPRYMSWPSEPLIWATEERVFVSPPSIRASLIGAYYGDNKCGISRKIGDQSVHAIKLKLSEVLWPIIRATGKISLKQLVKQIVFDLQEPWGAHVGILCLTT